MISSSSSFSNRKNKDKNKTNNDVGDDNDGEFTFCCLLQQLRGCCQRPATALRTFFVLFLFLMTLTNIGLHSHYTTTTATTYYHDINIDLPSRQIRIKNEKNSTIMSHNSSFIDDGGGIDGGGIDDGIIVSKSDDKVLVQKSTMTMKNSSSLSLSELSSETKTKTKIIGFSDTNYKEIALKWYKELELLGYTNHMIVAHDVPTENYLKEQIGITIRYDTIHANANANANANQQESSNNNFTTSITIDKCAKDSSSYDNQYPIGKRNQIYRRRLFGSRWNYILKQLQQNYNVLVTDVDNVFLKYKNMIEFENSKFDSYFAYGGTIDTFPRNIYKKMGFTICGGMSWLRGSSPGVIEIVKTIITRCGCETTFNCHCSCDDQVILNSIMLTEPIYKVKWDDDDHDDDNSNNNNSNKSSNGTKITKIKIPMKEEDINWNSMTGTVLKTGHRVKIWDRHTAFRRQYDPNEINMICPDTEKSWIAMPSGIDRMKVKELWMEGCGGIGGTGGA